MITMHPYLISQLTAYRQAGLAADANARRLARQARKATRTAIRPSLALVRPLHLTLRLRDLISA